jgi:hypothetical protein
MLGTYYQGGRHGVPRFCHFSWGAGAEPFPEGRLPQKHLPRKERQPPGFP